mmetsp:Transcript_56404/g.132280  ORF Transcript_56404/g.132280 Transcript_56404/m.132280 type:complete len:455 (+) Transcript_56404:50-1414(+)
MAERRWHLAAWSCLCIALLLNGCGRSGHDDHHTYDCLETQSQCSQCVDHICTGCKEGYTFLNETLGAAHGRCIATCIGQPLQPRPPRPSSPLELNGKAWPQKCINKSEGHFFGIGDWGGDRGGGHTWTNPGKCAGSGNVTDSGARPCQDADHWAQKYVARQMKTLAPTADPDYIVNVGDNFYPGGMATQCGANVSGDPTGQWAQVYVDNYRGEGLSFKEWFSVLGNHDYGGINHKMGWDDQIFYTWDSQVWILPSQTWRRRVQYENFAVEFFFLDSNAQDARNPDMGHRICQGGGECWGMTDTTCPDMLDKAWQLGLQMMEDGLRESTAEWHIVVTHFPGPSITGNPTIQALNERHGLDLVVTGHAHIQEMGEANGIPYIITGGGGGITSDSSPAPDGDDSAYGFIDFTINGSALTVDMHTWGGEDGSFRTFKRRILQPHARRKQLVQQVKTFV